MSERKRQNGWKVRNGRGRAWKLAVLSTTALALAGGASTASLLRGTAPEAARTRAVLTASDATELYGPGAICGSPLVAGVQLAGVRAATVESSATMPLIGGLGTMKLQLTSKHPMTRAYFDQGLALTYGFNHADAIRSFKEAQKIEPDCALCYWGEALALGPNINVPMPPEANRPAVKAMDRARRLAKNAGPKEQALIAALDTRYYDGIDSDPSDGEPPTRAELDLAYVEAMARVAARFPDDDDIAVLYAEAMMDLSPWDYWEADGETPKGRTAEIIEVLERVLRRNPDHAAAIHLYIHTVEASKTPERAEPYADRLGALMPGAGHLVHMPSHIYYRIGRYRDSIAANQAAMEADERLVAKLESSGLYPLVYYPHNIHFVVTSGQMAGAGDLVLEAARKLDAALPLEAAAAIPLVQPIKAAPLFAFAQYGTPGEILTLADPGADVPFIRGLWHYARGIAHVARGDLAAAGAEADRIARINAETDFTPLIESWVPAPEVLAIAAQVLNGRIAQAAGYPEAAVRAFAAAAEIQSALPYMEPPYWYYPVRQSLGAALLQVGRTEEAKRAFEAALEESPRNGMVYFGLRETHKALGDSAAAAAADKDFRAAWAGDPDTLTLEQL